MRALRAQRRRVDDPHVRAALVAAPGRGATVAVKVMKSGETAGHDNGRLDVQTARKRSAQA